MRARYINLIILLMMMSLSRMSTGADASTAVVTLKDGVIHVFPGKPKDGVIAHEQIGDKKLWISGTRRNHKTRQIRITSYVGNAGALTPVTFQYPFGEASATWNMEVTQEGDIVSLMLPWNGTLIGDIMDVNEGEDRTAETRKRLGVAEPDSKLPVMYSSGDSISLGYWPYLEAELNDTVNVYYQRELAKDIPDIVLVNNGVARLAYDVLQKAYENKDFKPDYWLVNFGLHMINSHQHNLPDYSAWVETFIAYAKEKNVTLIFVNTPAYQQSFRPQQNRTVITFNDLMKTSADTHKVPVIDLHTCTLQAVKELGDKKVYVDGVHFTDEVKKRQAAHIAKRVREIVDQAK